MKNKSFTTGYKTYDTSDGYGDRDSWRSTFYKAMGKDEAESILSDQSQETRPHRILGVSRNASRAEIKKAFRDLIMKWHPDKNPGREAECTEMSKRIIAAYTLLTS